MRRAGWVVGLGILVAGLGCPRSEPVGPGPADAAAEAVVPEAPSTSPDASAPEAPVVAGPEVTPPVPGAARVVVDPARPAPGATFVIRGGPITFRNGCEGVGRVEVQRTDAGVTVRWWPREVPPDAMCTMALHEEWVEATVAGLPAGRWVAEVTGLGRTPFEVGI